MHSNTAATESSDVAEAAQFLTFVLDSEEYAIDILRVQEIKIWGPVTKVPRSPKHMLGVINLRGSIVPIVDLRYLFGLPATDFTNKTAVIIVRAIRDQVEKILGLVVDRVSEVYHFESKQIQASAAIGGTIDSEFIDGLAKAEENLVIILNLERIVDANSDADVVPTSQLNRGDGGE